MGRNKYIQCEVCGKTLRSDKLKAHKHSSHLEKKTKYPMKSCPTCNVKMIAWHLPRHQKLHQKSTKDILENVKIDQMCYEDRKAMGKVVEEVLQNNRDIDPRSLRTDYVKALEINNYKTNKTFGVLRTWQQELLDLYVAPSDREIIWVYGERGAEGKSWFQEYLVDFYGSRRVFQSNLDKRSDGILHTLTKRTLALIDIFIFNIPRSFATLDVPYTLLEEIKDGQAISSKYDSKILRFKTPNIVVVFSNEDATETMMSKDRWKIFKIDGNNLIPKQSMDDYDAGERMRALTGYEPSYF